MVLLDLRGQKRKQMSQTETNLQSPKMKPKLKTMKTQLHQLDVSAGQVRPELGSALRFLPFSATLCSL